MSVISRSRLSLAIAIPASIFLACTAIAFSAKFQQYPQPLSIAITLDLLLIAPLAYYLIIRKTSVSAFTVARVLLLGIMLAGLLLSKSNTYFLGIIKTWISPIIEVALIAYLGRKFYRATKVAEKNNSAELDFLMHCRIILRSVLGSQKLANIIASEVAVFYYLFARKAKGIDNKKNFTCYRENGIVLVLSVFLSLFVIETIGMHLILQLWSKTAAWILSGFGLYTCLQLLAHIKSLMARPIVITNDSIILRHGIMGGDAIVPLNNIEKIVQTSKLIQGGEIVKMALIKGLEKHQLAIYLKEPIMVTKTFGIQKTARIILVSVDKHRNFLEALNQFNTIDFQTSKL
jgi:hypothetical protein